MSPAENQKRAFAVANSINQDVLNAISNLIDLCIETGASLEEFVTELNLIKKGR